MNLENNLNIFTQIRGKNKVLKMIAEEEMIESTHGRERQNKFYFLLA